MSDAILDQRRLVLMFTDMADSSALRTKLGDLAYMQTVLLPHHAIFRNILSDVPGAQEITDLGDGFLVTFSLVSDAVNAALRFQHKMRVHPWGRDDPRARIGIHIGKGVVVKAAEPGKIDIQGHAVDMCARVMSLSVGGQILMTRHAYDDAHQYVREHPQASERGRSLELQWRFHGRYRFKGKEDAPIEVFEVGAHGFAPFTKPPNTKKASRILEIRDLSPTRWWKASRRPGRNEKTDEGEPSLEIAYVLFMDIVSYSLLPMDHQSEAIQALQRIVRRRKEFEKALADHQVICLPTGDGMALAFFSDPCAPLQCAREISLVLKQGFAFKLRMGIHFGPIYRHADINSNANLAGGGINLAQRIMDCGDGGHVLVSKAVAEVLVQLSQWKDMVHQLGEHEVKHGLRIEVFNIFDEKFGNRETPSKLKVGDAKPVKERALDVALGRKIPVLVPTALVALIRQAQSIGLKGVLESDPDYSVTPNDIRSKPLVLEFHVDSKGQPAPLDVTLRITSPDFKPKSQSKIIRVPPLADSEICTFLLTPTQLGDLVVNVELYSGDVTLVSRMLRTHASTSNRMPAETIKAIVTIPLIVLVRPSDLAILTPEGKDARPHFRVENQSLDLLLAQSELRPLSDVLESKGDITEELSPDILRAARARRTSELEDIDERRSRPPWRIRSRNNLTVIAVLLIGAAIVVPVSFLTRSVRKHEGPTYWHSVSGKIFERPDQIVIAEVNGAKSGQTGLWERAKTPGEYVLLKPGVLRFNLAFRQPGPNPAGHKIDVEWVIGYLGPPQRIIYQFDGTRLKRETASIDGSASTTVPCRLTGHRIEFDISIEASRVLVASPSCDHQDSYEAKARDLTLGKVSVKGSADFFIRLLENPR